MHVSENKTTNSSPATKNSNEINPFFQPKLTVNEPGDEYELEADRMAEHVMRMPANDQPFFKPMQPTISRLQRKCKDCEDEEKLQRKEKTIQRQPPNSPSTDLTISGDWEDQYHNAPHINNCQLNNAPLSFNNSKSNTNYADANLDLVSRGVDNPSEYDKDYNSLWQSNLDFTRSHRLGTIYKNLRQKTLLGYVLPEPSKGMSDDVFLTNKMSLTGLDSATSGDHPALNEGSGIIIPLKTFTKHFDENNLFKKDKPQQNGSNKGYDTNTSVENYVNGLNPSGKKLNESTKKFFEPKLGYDLSDVKIHTDNEAAKSAESINALAYTVGNNIVFNQNQFNPENDSGKKLLAHELTHVVQQNSGLHTKQIQRFPWLFANHLNKEVDETVNETISNAPNAFNAWNGNFNWKSRFAIQLNALIGQVWLVMRLSTTAPRNVQRFWERAIYNKWSGNKYLKINIPGVSQGPCKFLIRVDIRWVTDPAKAHYPINPKAPGDNCGGRAGLGGTCSMIDWGTTENTDITHEFGHMIGNKEEYFTTDGHNFATGGRTGFRDAGAGIMNNPADHAFLRHFNLLKNQVAEMLGLPHSAISVIFNNESIPNCTPDSVDSKKQASI